MHITNHYPIHRKITSFQLIDSQFYEVNFAYWNLIRCVLELEQTVFFDLAKCVKNNSVDFILLYEQFLVTVQQRCTHYHLIKKYRPNLPQYLIHTIQNHRHTSYRYQITQSQEYRILLNSLNRYIHYELRAMKKIQWQEFSFHLESKNIERF